MHEYETFVYLDVQKTGSSFISSFLNKFCSEKTIRLQQHAGMPADCDKSKFYFMSVRDPLDQYLSLYSFGCQTDGQLFQRLQKKGYDDFYDGTWSGFRSWLEFILEPEHAQLLGGGYGGKRSGKVSELLGYQSWRVLSLAIPDAKTLLANCESREEMIETYNNNNLVGFTVRHESFQPDLAELVSIRLRTSLTDPDEALRFIETGTPKNTSDRIDRYETKPKLGKKLKALLREREWLMYGDFGY